MGISVFGELLILFLITANCARIFFLRYGKVDSLTILAPISFVLCLLQIFAWGIDVFSAILLFISLFCSIINFRALLRFSSGLYVDYYSIAFKFGAVFTLILAVAEIVLILVFMPARMLPSSFKVVEQKFRVTGNLLNNIEIAKYFEKSCGEVKIYKPENKEIAKPETIILIADKRADTFNYEPYIFTLVQKGYTVYSADFYSKDLKWLHSVGDLRFLRRAFLVYKSLFNKERFESEKEFYTYNSGIECNAIFNFVSNLRNEENDENLQEKSNSIFIVSDWMSENAVQDFYKLNSQKVGGIINLCDFAEYQTKGYGFVEQTDPFVAFCLGFKKDSKLKNVSLIAAATEEKIENISKKTELLEGKNDDIK